MGVRKYGRKYECVIVGRKYGRKYERVIVGRQYERVIVARRKFDCL